MVWDEWIIVWNGADSDRVLMKVQQLWGQKTEWLGWTFVDYSPLSRISPRTMARTITACRQAMRDVVISSLSSGGKTLRSSQHSLFRAKRCSQRLWTIIYNGLSRTLLMTADGSSEQTSLVEAKTSTYPVLSARSIVVHSEQKTAALDLSLRPTQYSAAPNTITGLLRLFCSRQARTLRHRTQQETWKLLECLTTKKTV